MTAKRIAVSVVLLAGLALVALASLALAGLASLRQPDPVTAATGTFLLVCLPVLGIASIFPRRKAGLLVAIVLWPIVLLIGLPLYFPGERVAAVSAGLSLLGLSVGLPLPSAGVQALSRGIDGLLAEPHAERPPVEANSLALAMIPPPDKPLSEDEVALPYEGRGHTLQIPVTLEGPGKQSIEVNMLFDTGATYTTLDRATVEGLGYRIGSDAPTISSATANGEIEAPLFILSRLWLGGMEVEAATVAICDLCAYESSQGLLGLNVSSRFLVTLDTARQEMVLKPRAERSHTLDVTPWLKLEARTLSWPNGRMDLDLTGTNRSDRVIRSADVEVACGEKSWRVPLNGVEPRGQAHSSVQLPGGGGCDALLMNLAAASW
jgi:predicted aspartyl protease